MIVYTHNKVDQPSSLIPTRNWHYTVIQCVSVVPMTDTVGVRHVTDFMGRDNEPYLLVQVNALLVYIITRL